MTSPPSTDIILYTSGTPNGQKASITLEELGLHYEVKNIEISKNVQKESWFLRINPNGRIPAIVDKTPAPNGQAKEKRIFESGALMLYLCQRYDPQNHLNYPYDTDQYWEVVEWLIWMQSGLGPMQGQANHFYRYAPEKIEYGIKRYQTETRRLYQVLEDRLAEQQQQQAQKAAAGSSNEGGPWIVGDRMTIADIANFAWVNWAEWAGIDVKPFELLNRWLDRINERSAVKRGLDVPEPFLMKEKLKSKEGEEEYAQHHSRWVMKGQEADQKKHG
ncbi:Glutathione S-transferase 2 [Xanthoria parietina]